MTGPSERAVEAVKDTPLRTTLRVLAAVTDPALGEHAYVRLGDVLEKIRSLPFSGPLGRDLRKVADHLEREHREGRL
jgi:hypothetical protein